MRSSKAADRVPQDQAATVRFLGGGQRSHVVLTHQPRRSWRGRPARPSRGRGQLADRPGSEGRGPACPGTRWRSPAGDGSTPVHTWSWAAGRAGLAPLSGGSVAPALALGGARRGPPPRPLPRTRHWRGCRRHAPSAAVPARVAELSSRRQASCRCAKISVKVVRPLRCGPRSGCCPLVEINPCRLSRRSGTDQWVASLRSAD